MSFNQYIKDTRVELKHVAWPTHMQTVVYTLLVIAVSILVALYIGFFDFFFTRGLDEMIRRNNLSGTPSAIPAIPASPVQNVDFNVSPDANTVENGATTPVKGSAQ